MLKFTNKRRLVIVFAGVVIAVLAMANIAAASEGQTEPGAVGQATVEVLPVYGGDNATPAEEPILEPGDNQTVAVVHDLPPAITPAPTPDQEPVSSETVGKSDTVITVNSHLGVPVEPAAGFVAEPVLGSDGAESLGVAQSTGWTVADWAIAATIAVAVGAGMFGGMHLFTRRRPNEALAN